MNNPVSIAQFARQNLAQGLNALQQPGAPPAILQAAQPIAEAMGALHNIEASHGTQASQYAPIALDAARRALASLQSQHHPLAEQAVHAVAGSLSMIHQLTQSLPPPANAGAPQPPPMGQPPAHQPARAHAGPPPMPQGAPAFAPGGPGHAHAPAPAAAVAQPQPVRSLPPIEAPPGVPRVDVALGAHSATNFYKGLASNDIIEAGGIFVATYQLPAVGQNLLLNLSMPGGYEFQALGVVRWAREAPLSGGDSPPGFGAQFTEISPEARQLVYRYVRNREPLFYDDF